MDVKELIQHLQGFDENHHVVIQDENMYRDTEKRISEVKFDGQNCVIKTECDYQGRKHKCGCNREDGK